MATSTYYEVLGVSSVASHEELRDAYRDQALLQHPDRHRGSDIETAAAAERRMLEVNAAWKVLRDPVSRAGYDAELARLHREGSPTTPLEEWDGPVTDGSWPSERPTSALAPLVPLLLLVGLLLAIVVFTAYAKTG